MARDPELVAVRRAARRYAATQAAVEASRRELALALAAAADAGHTVRALEVPARVSRGRVMQLIQAARLGL